MRGHNFATTSDTEVILHLYEERGPDCVEAFNGDFAFAVWDSRNNRLMLARDRMGVRPLFHATRNGCLYFASEVKALLEAPGVSAALDPLALDQIFTFWFPLGPRTPFKDIQELPPAHVLIAEGDNVTVRPYWKLDYPDAADAGAWDNRSEADIAEELRAAPARRHPHPAALRRAGRRLSERRARLLDHHRRRQAHQARPAAHLFGHLRVRRSSTRAPTSRTWCARSAPSTPSVACTTADIGRAFPNVIRSHRTADPAHRAGAADHAVAARA